MAYTPEEREALQASICEHIAAGFSLRSWILEPEQSRPTFSTIFAWLESDEAFRTKYARAREVQAEVLVDEMQDIVDDSANDYMLKKNKDGSDYVAMNEEHLARTKMRLEQRRWFAEKLLPKKYGTKADLLGGVNGRVKAVTIDFTEGDDE